MTQRMKNQENELRRDRRFLPVITRPVVSLFMVRQACDERKRMSLK
jgi:hypothetical protein